MKRSEAIEIIDEILYEHELPLLRGISKEILSKLEKAGMQPPAYYNRELHNEPECDGYVNEWEAE